MNVPLDLTRNEREQLKQLLEQIGRESGQPVSLNDMFAQWTAFVAAVERGYDDSIYEYTNDLSGRDRLEHLVRAAPTVLRSKLKGALAPVDGRFMSATEDAARPLTEIAGEIPPWWRRVPKHRDGELGDDLQALGHLG